MRERRIGWATGVDVRLTSRDLAILLAIGLSGVLRTRDLVRLFFRSRGTCNDRLRKLFCAGFVTSLVADLADDNFYALTQKGRDVVLNRASADPAAVRAPRRLPTRLGHHLAIVDARIHFALACRASSRYVLARFRRDADLGRSRYAAAVELVPDALVTLADATTGERYDLALEIDLGTESAASQVVRGKLATYARYAATRRPVHDAVDPLIVFVATGFRRVRSVAEALDHAGVRARVVFTLLSQLNECNALGGAYATVADVLAAPTPTDVNALFSRLLLP